MQFRVTLQVMLKHGVLDSQGQTLESALHSIGYPEVSQVAVGKCLQMTLEASDEPTVHRRVREMADKLLSNPIVETYTFEVRELIRS